MPTVCIGCPGALHARCAPDRRLWSRPPSSELLHLGAIRGDRALLAQLEHLLELRVARAVVEPRLAAVLRRLVDPRLQVLAQRVPAGQGG
eukprot:3073758-Prymnesium_polylepis.2